MDSVHFRQAGALLLCVLLLMACKTKNKSGRVLETVHAKGPSAPAEAAPSSGGGQSADEHDPDPYTVVFARHVEFHEDSGVNLKAEWLQGRMYPTRPDVVPSLDDPHSFKVEIEEGKTALGLPELAHLLSIGALRNSKLKNIRIAAHSERQVEIRGTVHKLIALPVQVLGALSVTPDGRISIQIESIKVLKIPFKAMLHAFKLNAADLIDVRNSDAIQTEGDKVFLRTDKLLPAPRKLGKITDVHFNRDGDLEEDYGTHSSEELPMLPAQLDLKKWPNFIRLTGGTVRFGRLTMQDADLLLIDTSPGTWFGFDLQHYRDQLAAGDMHMTANGGLRVWIPDIGKVPPKKPG